MSKIKRYAIDLMGEDGFAEYLNENMEGIKNGKNIGRINANTTKAKSTKKSA